ncbi:MAG: tetratricopeptide repeat protein [Methylococcales bacterium]
MQKQINASAKSRVMALLADAKFKKAKQQAKSLIDQSPKDVEAQYLFGLSLVMSKDYVQAIEWLNKARLQKPNDAALASNLGVAYLRSGDYKCAIDHLTKAVEIQPSYEQARYNLGSAYIKNKQAELAIEHYRYLSINHKDNADYVCALADAVRESGQWQESIKLYNKALSMDESQARAHNNMGPLMRHIQQMDKAIEHCKKGIELDSKNMVARKNLGDCYVQIEELEEAMDVYADAYDIDSENADLCVAIAKVWLEISDHNEASSWFQKALNLDADNLSAQCGLVNIIRDMGDLSKALDILRPLLEKEPNNVEVLISMADTLWEDGDAETALEHLRKVQQLQPQRTTMYAKIGQILSSSGDVDGALEEYHTALKQSPKCIPALNGLATSQRGKLDVSYVKTIENMFDDEKLRSGSLSSLHNALAHYYDSQKQREKAAEHMKKGNDYQWEHKSKRGWEYDVKKYEERITKLIEIYTPEYFERVKGLGNPDETPTFIVAMPRSGTTLTEQILARHSKVLGIGERNFASQAFSQFTQSGENDINDNLNCLNNITQHDISDITQRYLMKLNELKDKAGKSEAVRVVDKMPDNYSLVGWILTLFPNAKIIHAKRDARDVALSCWLTQFGAIRWACNEEHLYERIRQYQRIMNHWHKVIPDRFIEMNYEDLVANQEDESKRLIDYIGLDWDESCLRFFESDRLVRTASITQVRQPIYKKSVAKWESYKDHISELFDHIST